jgi:hypothetical protein
LICDGFAITLMWPLCGLAGALGSDRQFFQIPMNWLRYLSLSRALALAFAWPVLLTLIASIALGLGRGYQWWIEQRSDAAQAFFFRLRITSWPRTVLLVLGPALIFLALWSFLQVRPVDHAA